MAQKTAITFLNIQVQTLSTTVANQGSGAVTAGQFSNLSSFVSTLTYQDFTNLSTYTSSLTGQVNSNSTSISNLIGLSSYVSSIQLETLSSAVSTVINSNTAQTTAISALQTFSTVQVSTFNQTMYGVSTTLSTTVSTVNALSTIQATMIAFSTIQVSTFNQSISTSLSSAIAVNNAQSTAISSLQAFSTVQATSNVAFGQASTNIVTLLASTTLFNYGQRRGQTYYGPWVEFGSAAVGTPKWGNPNGTSAQGTSTIMSGDNQRGVTLINNTSTQDVTLPLYMGIATNGYNTAANMVPSTFGDIMRFAHIGVPGSNSSITINLVSSGTATDAITLSAGDVITMIYKGSGTGGPSSTSNYYYLTSL